MADHGTRQCYAEGCRLPECKAAQAKYMREYKARRAGVPIEVAPPGRPKKGATVTALPTSQSDTVRQVGPAEQAVLDELATLTSAETRKAAAQAALAMARIVDNPAALAQQKGAAELMTKVMEDLRQGSTRRKGRLASVQQMTAKSAG